MSEFKIKDLSLGERPREKFAQKGAQALSDAELLSILIRTGIKQENVVELSQRILLSNGGSLNTLCRNSWEDMAKIRGVGAVKAITIAAAFEIGRRASLPETNSIVVQEAAVVFNYMAPLLRDLNHEECWALYLNSARKIISKERVSMGGLNSTPVDVRIVLKHALSKQAPEIVLVHNHPSGNLVPSSMDKQLTYNMCKAASTIEIKVLDHVIISNRGYFSFSEHGLL